MKIAVTKETRPFENRVAISPETVRKFMALGASITIETGAGVAATFTDSAYKDSGAEIVSSAAAAVKGAKIWLKVQRPLQKGETLIGAGGKSHSATVDELALMGKDCLLIGLLSPDGGSHVNGYGAAGICSMAMEFVPRISRAQSMDVLSSQANLAGYRAVLEAASYYGHALPMMMTAAGTIPPARILIMGVGVAGLQAIATARRLGAIVSATDVRLATKEQVKSLGAQFVAVENDESRQAETSGGYAKEMSDDYKRQQAELITATIKKQDIVICTALIPGRKAPTLVTKEMVKSMKPGSVIVDLAIEQGGNCESAVYAQVVTVEGVTIVGHANLPSHIAADASALYAKNLLAFLTPMFKDKALAINWDDEIIKATLLTKDGKVVHPSLAGK